MNEQATETTPLLSEEEIETLVEAQKVLRNFDERSRTEQWAGPPDALSYNAADNAFVLGRSGEAADMAANAIFNVLNCVNAYGLVPVDEAYLHYRRYA